MNTSLSKMWGGNLKESRWTWRLCYPIRGFRAYLRLVNFENDNGNEVSEGSALSAQGVLAAAGGGSWGNSNGKEWWLMTHQKFAKNRSVLVVNTNVSSVIDYVKFSSQLLSQWGQGLMVGIGSLKNSISMISFTSVTVSPPMPVQY